MIASSEVAAVHTSGIDSEADFGVSSSPGTLPDNSKLRFQVPAGAPSGPYLIPITARGLFPVTPGSHTFYFLGDENFGSLNVRERQLTLLFIPTSYGTVTPTRAAATTMPEFEKDEIGGTSSTTRQTVTEADNKINTVPEDREMRQQGQIDNQQKQIDALKALVCTQHAQAGVCRKK